MNVIKIKRASLLFGVALAFLSVFLVVVDIFGFPGPLGISINFGRVSIGVAVLIVYAPAMLRVFTAHPAPRSDYLTTGIVMTWLSNELFSVGNEFGRIFKVDMSIFTNPVAGFFSLIAVVSGMFYFMAPDTEDTRKRTIWAGVCGALWGVVVVIIAPLFR